MSHSVHIQLLAAELDGVFDVAAANRKGIPTWAVDHERDIGRIVAMFPGVYRSAAVPPTPMLWLPRRCSQGVHRRTHRTGRRPGCSTGPADAPTSARSSSHTTTGPGSVA